MERAGRKIQEHSKSVHAITVMAQDGSNGNASYSPLSCRKRKTRNEKRKARNHYILHVFNM